MSAAGFVVTRPYPGSGLGSNLLSLAGAVWIAKQLSRAVIVDWRATAFLKDPARNYFTEFFEPVPEIQGVPVFYTPSAEAGDHEEAPAEDQLVLEPHEVPPLLGTPRELPRYLVLTAFHAYERVDRTGTPAERHRRLKDFYRFVLPRSHVVEAIDAFWDEHLRDRFVVGLNISTGNGEYEKGQYYHGRVDITLFERGSRFLRRIEHAFELAVRRLPPELRDGARIFFATDSYPMHDLLERLPNAVTRRTVFPPPGVGRIYGDYAEQGYSDTQAALDTVVDMLALARCNALIRNTGTVFNTYPLVVNDWFSGNVRNIETLYAGYWIAAARRRVLALARRY